MNHLIKLHINSLKNAILRIVYFLLFPGYIIWFNEIYLLRGRKGRKKTNVYLFLCFIGLLVLKVGFPETFLSFNPALLPWALNLSKFDLLFFIPFPYISWSMNIVPLAYFYKQSYDTFGAPSLCIVKPSINKILMMENINIIDI